MTEKDGKFIMTQEEHEAAISLCEQLAYAGGLSSEMMRQATRLELWEVLDIEHDTVLSKKSRLQELREVVYDIDDDNHDLDYLQYSLYNVVYWSQMLIYNREVTNAEIEAVRAYCTYEDASVYEELRNLNCCASLPDFVFIQRVHMYIDEIYAHILRHTYDSEK